MQKEILIGLVRHLLTALGSLLVAKGITDDATVAAAVGALVTLTGLIWSIVHKQDVAATIQSAQIENEALKERMLPNDVKLALSNARERDPYFSRGRWSKSGLLVLALSVLSVLFSGCQNNPIQSAGVTGGYDPSTHNVTGGITVTFKTPPSSGTQWALSVAGAKLAKSDVGAAYTLPATYDDAFVAAIIASAKEGATFGPDRSAIAAPERSAGGPLPIER